MERLLARVDSKAYKHSWKTHLAEAVCLYTSSCGKHGRKKEMGNVAGFLGILDRLEIRTLEGFSFLTSHFYSNFDNLTSYTECDWEGQM
ncbi:hypothetical protein V6N13_048157 [Hibiscus sabdariffa]